MIQHAIMRVALPCLLGRLRVKSGSTGQIARSFAVVRRQADEFHRTAAAPLDQLGQPGRDARVRSLPEPLEQRVVGHLLKNLMGERILPKGRGGLAVPGHNQPATDQRRQVSSRNWVDRPQRFFPEHRPDHARRLQGLSFRCGQTVQASLHHRCERARH